MSLSKMYNIRKLALKYHWRKGDLQTGSKLPNQFSHLVAHCTNQPASWLARMRDLSGRLDPDSKKDCNVSIFFTREEHSNTSFPY